MQYFKLFDDFAPEGDVYRFDGKNWQTLFEGEWLEAYAPLGDTGTAWLDKQVQYGILGGNLESKWEEIEVP